MPAKTRPESYVLELVPIAGTWSEVPADVRLRRMLKAARRSYGFRVLVVRQGEADANRETRRTSVAV